MITIILFISLLTTMFLSLKYLDNTCNTLEYQSDKIEELIQKDDWGNAYDASIKLMDKWSDYSYSVSVFVDHKEIDNINSELWKLTQYTKCKTKDESLAAVHTIKFYLKHIVQLEKVNIQNIF